PIRANSVLVHGDSREAGLMETERLKPAEITGILGSDYVARVDQQLGDQIEGLLRAGGDHHLVRSDPGGRCQAGRGRGLCLLVARYFSDALSQTKHAIGRTVLKCAAAMLRQDLVSGLANSSQWEQIGSGQATGERRDVGSSSDL